MGYTHYWKHTRRFTNADWQEIVADLTSILESTVSEGIAIGDNCGDKRLENIRDASFGDMFGFNGIGEDSHETFLIEQNRAPLESWQSPSDRGRAFCKTARKPYDVAVTACLVYLDSRFPENVSVGSDGYAQDWESGLALARRALPRLDNVLAIPAEIRFDSMLSHVHMRGGKYGIATTNDGTLCLIDDSRLSIVGTFTTAESQEWVTMWVQRVADERKRKLPCKCSTLDRWEARKMRTFREAAESLGYLGTTVDA